MIRVRKLNPTPPKRGPMGRAQWVQLLRKAISKAQLVKDARQEALQAALLAGTAEPTLRKMSIICEADILREFPDSVT